MTRKMFLLWLGTFDCAYIKHVALRAVDLFVTCLPNGQDTEQFYLNEYNICVMRQNFNMVAYNRKYRKIHGLKCT